MWYYFIMKLVICGSSKKRNEKVSLIKKLEDLGLTPIIDEWTIRLARGEEKELLKTIQTEHSAAKRQYGFIKWYYDAIQQSDGILVANYPNEFDRNYIGANTFLEMGYAHVLGKKIFLLNGLTEQEYILDEVRAMDPIILNGDLSKINLD